jgi:hypothetical protein
MKNTIAIIILLASLKNISFAQANNFINPNGSITLNTNNTEGIINTSDINESEGSPQSSYRFST